MSKEEEIEYLNTMLNVMQKVVNRRHAELLLTLPKYEDELKKLPQILKVRIKALKEVNPQKFADNPVVELSTLAAYELIKKIPENSTMIIKDVSQAYEKYGLVRGDDVPSVLATELYFSYHDDVKSGAISEKGKILDINKSKVMQVPHLNERDGLPIDAKEIVAKFNKPKVPYNRIEKEHNL